MCDRLMQKIQDGYHDAKLKGEGLTLSYNEVIELHDVLLEPLFEEWDTGIHLKDDANEPPKEEEC